MWAALTAALVALASYITYRVSARQAKRIREEEERNRRDRRKELLAVELTYLKQGIGDSWSNEFPDVALRSLGNVAYLIWLLNYEPKFRSHRGDAKNPYPPDWEWRRRFVFLRDRGTCQGCKKGSNQGITLDCHHVKPIGEFGAGETGMHSISNLIALCQLCHAEQHLGNKMLANRAFRSSSGSQNWPQYSSKRSIQKRTDNNPIGKLTQPDAIEVHPSSDALTREILSADARPPGYLGRNAGSNGPVDRKRRGQKLYSRPMPNAKSITEGLARIDEQVADTKLQDADQLLGEEDQYGHCDFCDKEILVDPFYVSDKGRHLCDECYISTGGRE